VTSSPPDRWPAAARRLFVIGLLVAAAAGLAAGALEAWRVGATPAGAFGRIERDVTHRFDAAVAGLSRTASALAARDDLRRALDGERAEPGARARGRDSARVLFDILQTAGAEPIAVTVYNAAGAIRAWSGRASEIPLDRVNGPAALFVAPGPVGLRLVQVVPVMALDDSAARRVGAVAAERVISPASALRNLTAGEYELATPVAPVSLRARYEGAGDAPRPQSFLLRAPSGEPVLEAAAVSSEVDAGLARSRRAVASGVLALLALALAGVTGPLLDRRDARRDNRRAYLRATWSIAGLAVVAWAIARLTVRPPWDLLLSGVLLLALAGLIVGVAVRARVAWRPARVRPADAPLAFRAAQVTGGAIAALLVVAAARVVFDVADAMAPAGLRFSVYPWDAARLARLIALILTEAAALWVASAALAFAIVRWRVPRREGRAALGTIALWLLPGIVLAIVARAADWRTPPLAIVAGTAAAAVAAFYAPRWAARFRHAPQAGRLLTLFVALLVPALLLYPSARSAAERATRRLIETRYAPQALAHPQELQARLERAQREIDAIAGLEGLIASAAASRQTTPDPAFTIWSQTALAEARLTSAVELYGPDGSLVSRFALNFPEYAPDAQTYHAKAERCTWEVFGEAAPFGSEERRMLHAERGICRPQKPQMNAGQPQMTQMHADRSGAALAGTIIVHVMLDYRALPFISSQSPYFEVFRAAAGDAVAPPDIELVLYGWGLSPTYASGVGTWPIDDALFRRIYRSREPFWRTLDSGERRSHVYIANDRAGIYAIGYPALGLFDLLVHLAELATLAALAYIAGVALTAVFTRVARERPRGGRALLREIRASFTRKLFLAFVAASVVPVLTLALVIRQYFAGELRDGVEEAAARTAAVAQRVIEESLALQRRGSEAPVPITDDVMVWISQVIDQDVNIFDGARLEATSERDLFASGLLPTRTPDDVYRAIVLERQPSFVGRDAIGDFPYTIAATPVRTEPRDKILTVPLAPRQQEIEREIADLDRGVHLAALVFILFGAAIGLSMAERIGDPVKRLTRATRRIARGDFDARIAVRSADEFRRLVDAFNRMAGELKAQRARLERTHRLEAWAEMARQVAHEIKNPLTPIQLSADHLRRVHEDRGEPLSPVLEECVDSILAQVRLLRQIASEFSSFASAPTARPSPVALARLVDEVVQPYRTGLAGRIAIDTHVAPSLPDVHVDRTLIARALTNVLENALHAMPGSGRLTIEAADDPPFVRLQIRDTGVGMDRQALGRAFEPYFSTKATGTGLGLSIARRNVELNRGSIAVESEKGRGTTVTIRLPADSHESATATDDADQTGHG
jgi:signal transduction histidine kinase